LNQRLSAAEAILDAKAAADVDALIKHVHVHIDSLETALIALGKIIGVFMSNDGDGPPTTTRGDSNKNRSTLEPRRASKDYLR
jgi:hypothetical protein